MDEDKLHSDLHKGQQAKALLDNELLKDTLAYLKQSYIDAMIATKDPVKVLANKERINCLDDFRGHLNWVTSNGRMADHQIAELVRRQARQKKSA